MKKATETNAGLSNQISAMKKEGYTVFPAHLLGDNDGASLYSQYGVLNFASLSPSADGCDPHPKHSSIMPLSGGFLSSGMEMPVDSCGDEKLGYITWGSTNKLPNMVALANSLQPYTSTAMKFNVDTACGLGIRAMYRMFSGTAGQMAEVEIPFEQAGIVIRQRILDLQKKLSQLLVDRDNVTSSSADDAAVTEPAADISLVLDTLRPGAGEPSEQKQNDDGNQENQDTERFPHREAKDDINYYRSMSCDYLDEVIDTYKSIIADLRRDFGIWRKTNSALKKFLRKTNTSQLNHKLFYDLLSFGICFPEIRLTQNGSRQPDNNKWLPTIESLGWRNALTCRLERMNADNISRHVYLSNAWLDQSNPGNAQLLADKDIAALPAIDPMHPEPDLTESIRRFRIEASKDAELNKDISRRPCLHIFPVAYDTPGRNYYPTPAYWSIFSDVYQFAANIIRDRAIRKRNESMFGYVVYVHADYLERLVNQMNAANSDEKKQQIKTAEVNKIKSFLADKNNNGQAFAACTFTGSDGKDHDAFRIEQVSMANKTAAEADKTEIADISSIILFALECHPDLIGSTPGGASSSGGTYQREMLQIKQAKLATTQNLLLEVYNLVRDYNGWDEHLCWHIAQRTLTTLDRSHSGTIDE